MLGERPQPEAGARQRPRPYLHLPLHQQRRAGEKQPPHPFHQGATLAHLDYRLGGLAPPPQAPAWRPLVRANRGKHQRQFPARRETLHLVAGQGPPRRQFAPGPDAPAAILERQRHRRGLGRTPTHQPHRQPRRRLQPHHLIKDKLPGPGRRCHRTGFAHGVPFALDPARAARLAHRAAQRPRPLFEPRAQAFFNFDAHGHDGASIILTLAYSDCHRPAHNPILVLCNNHLI